MKLKRTKFALIICLALILVVLLAIPPKADSAVLWGKNSIYHGSWACDCTEKPAECNCIIPE
jgi:hypothetical protein